MAKKKAGTQDVAVAFTVPSYYIDEAVTNAIDSQVAKSVEAQVSSAVADAVGELVDKISREQVSKEIARILAEGWPTVNSYGERSGCGNRSLKDRIGEILNDRDRYSGNGRWIENLVKGEVNEAIKKHFDADIKAARESFKAQVDGVLSAVVKKAVGEHLGVKV